MDKEHLEKYVSVLLHLPGNAVQCLVQEINQLIIEKFDILLDEYKKHLVTVLKVLIIRNVGGADIVCWNLLRSIRSGGANINIFNINRFLTCHLMRLLDTRQEWFYKIPELIRGVVYSYLRLLEDYVNVKFKDIRHDVAKFVVQVIRDNFGEVIKIGRDFIRVMINVSRVPEIHHLWQDILHNPQQLHPEFHGVQQILRITSPRQILAVRVTPDMETRLRFMVTQVEVGRHHHYCDWFVRKFLLDHQTWSLKVDLIRFLVTCIHPTNEQLQSGKTPRWLIINWLLESCPPTLLAQAKLALMYDILFFNPSQDSIMDIEPVLLLINQSITLDRHKVAAKVLLEYLVFTVENFHPQSRGEMSSRVHEALKYAQQVGVIQNHSEWLLCKDFPASLIARLKKLFGSTEPEDALVEKTDDEYKFPGENLRAEFSDDDESDEDTSSDDDAEETDDVSIKEDEGPDDARSSFFKRLMREVDDESLSCNLIISKVCDNLNYLQLNHQDNQALARTLSQRIIENDDENPTLLSTSDPSHKSVLDLINKNPVFILFKNLDNVSRYRVN